MKFGDILETEGVGFYLSGTKYTYVHWCSDKSTLDLDAQAGFLNSPGTPRHVPEEKATGRSLCIFLEQHCYLMDRMSKMYFHIKTYMGKLGP